MSIAVVKRNGSRQTIDISKITSKVKFLISYIYPLTKVDLQFLTEQVESGLHDGISTREIDVFTARKCMELASTEPEYSILASRILINNHHKNTLTGFKDKMEKLYRRVDSSGSSCPLLNKTFYKFICANQRKIEAMIDYQRDYLLDPFGFLTLENQYCNLIEGKVLERPQDLYMKEAITVGMNLDDFQDQKALDEIHLIYDLLSTHKFTYATPTLNNAGMKNQQMSSCFLLGTKDNLESINKTLDDACKISKLGGGIGIHVSNLRSAGQLIRGTNGYSSGIRNFLRMYGTAADAYNQGGKRKGSFAIFLRDYHPDILEFIQLKNPIGDESQRARSLFLCVALSDLFWNAVKTDQDWHLIDPEEHLGLDELYGEEFETVVKELIKKKKYKRKMKARDLLKEIMKQQFEAGVPYIINFDHINNKSNLKHYMPVRSSNLCVSGDTEILTSFGYIPIKQIVEEGFQAKVWNGQDFKLATFSKTGVNQNLLEVRTSDGESMKCTPYHKFFIMNEEKKEIQIEAKNLRPGMELISCTFPLLEYGFNIFPIYTRIKWLSGFVDKYGFLKDNTITIKFASKALLHYVKRIGQTLGINPILSENELLIDSTDTLCLYELGLEPKNFTYDYDLPLRDKESIRIVSVIPLDMKETTYCFNEPETHRGIFNGIIAGNCVEITLPSNHLEYAVCNLASVILPSFVTNNPSQGDLDKLRFPNYYKWQESKDSKLQFDFQGLSKVVQLVTRTMDRIIDRNHYPIKETMLSNFLHRPIGIGTCGFADVCCLLRTPYDSAEGLQLTSFIYETIAYGAYSESSRLAKTLANPNKDQNYLSQQVFCIYDQYKKYVELKEKLSVLEKLPDSLEEYATVEKELKKYTSNPNTDIVPIAKDLGVYPSYYYGKGAPSKCGILQCDMWGDIKTSGMWNWDTLREHIGKFGLRNSLLTAQMPTASTAQIASCNEGAEPFTTNMYRRSVLSGEYLVFNRYLINDLISIGIWNDTIKNYLIASGGSIQNIEGIPDKLKLLYKTAWDMGLKIGLDHAKARGPWLDHSQSHNIFLSNSHPDKADRLYKALLYGWESGLKTGMYYLRTQPAIEAQKFSVPLDVIDKVKHKNINLNSATIVVEEQTCLLCGT